MFGKSSHLRYLLGKTPLFYIFSLFARICNANDIEIASTEHRRSFPQIKNCSSHSNFCLLQYNTSCDPYTERCKCPENEPIRISSELPCTRNKLLGQVCLHSHECSSVPNAACFASILFPIELRAVPTDQQWKIYNQITQNDDLNYLLNKMYGQCRCIAGFRAIDQKKCIRKSTEIQQTCEKTVDCGIRNSYCNLDSRRCHCANGFYYDSDKPACLRLDSLYHQFCVVSTDCNVSESNMRCIRSKCLCSPGYWQSNQTNCVPKTCRNDEELDSSFFICKSRSSVIFNSFLVKLSLFLLLNLILFNLLRFICCSKQIWNGRQIFCLHSNHRRSDLSHSLLSLPPYESILSDPDGKIHATVDRLPTYEEALDSIQNATSQNQHAKISGKSYSLSTLSSIIHTI